MNQLELEISNPCNEHCVHCYRHCFNTKNGFLSSKQAEDILKQAKSLEARSVIITGGEVLLNPQWKEIVTLADKMDFRISLLINGTMLKEDDADFLTSIKNLKEVQLSLYSLNEDDHDSVTTVKGSCEKTKNAIEILRKRKIPIFISIPAMQANKKSFADVMRWADKENINNCSDIWIFGTSDYKNTNLNQRLTDSDLEIFFEESMKDNGQLSYSWGKEHENQNLDEILFYGGATNSLCINGNGDIFPIIGWYEKLGNINTDSLKVIYENHPFLQKIRKIKASDFPECMNCTDSSFCDFCPNPHLNANNGELYKLDKDYCHFVHLRKIYAMERDYITFLSNSLNKDIKLKEKILSIEDYGDFYFSIEKRQYEENLSYCEKDAFILSPVNKTHRVSDIDISIVKESSDNFEIFGIDKKEINALELEDQLTKLIRYYTDNNFYLETLNLKLIKK